MGNEAAHAVKESDRICYLIMATDLRQPPLPLRVFDDRDSAQEWQAAVVDYHISEPFPPEDGTSWEDYETQLEYWRQSHPAGVTAARYRAFKMYEVPR